MPPTPPIMKLTRTNIRYWLMTVRDAATSLNISQAIESNLPLPSNPHQRQEHSARCAILRSLILGSIPTDIANILLETVSDPSPFDIVEAAKSKFKCSKQDHQLLRREAETTRLSTGHDIEKFFDKHEQIRARMLISEFPDIENESTYIDFVIKSLSSHSAFHEIRLLWLTNPPESLKTIRRAARIILDDFVANVGTGRTFNNRYRTHQAQQHSHDRDAVGCSDHGDHHYDNNQQIDGPVDDSFNENLRRDIKNGILDFKSRNNHRRNRPPNRSSNPNTYLYPNNSSHTRNQHNPSSLTNDHPGPTRQLPSTHSVHSPVISNAIDSKSLNSSLTTSKPSLSKPSTSSNLYPNMDKNASSITCPPETSATASILQKCSSSGPSPPSKPRDFPPSPAQRNPCHRSRPVSWLCRFHASIGRPSTHIDAECLDPRNTQSRYYIASQDPVGRRN